MDFILNLVGSDAVMKWIGEVALSKLMFWSLAFAVAARFHQKEVAKQFKILTDAINHAAETLGKRMDSFDQRMGSFDQRVKKLEDEQD